MQTVESSIALSFMFSAQAETDRMTQTSERSRLWMRRVKYTSSRRRSFFSMSSSWICRHLCCNGDNGYDGVEDASVDNVFKTGMDSVSLIFDRENVGVVAPPPF